MSGRRSGQETLDPRALVSRGQWSHWSEHTRGERPSSDRGRLEIWGYTGLPSYAPGESLELHVSTTARTFSVTIYRDGARREVVFRREQIAGEHHETPAAAYSQGCGWPVALAVDIPDDWGSGGYVVVFTAEDERGLVVQDGFFVLRCASPGSRTDLVLVTSTYTWQEYNDWGGGSGYSMDSSVDPERQRGASGFSPRLSFQRPWARGLIRYPVGAPRIAMATPAGASWSPRYEAGEWAVGNGFSYWGVCAGWQRFDALFVRWAERMGLTLDLISQWDLDQDVELLPEYGCAVSVGHDEYWSARGRGRLDSFVENGGSYLRLAGNILWQVRIEDAGRTQVCFKYQPQLDTHAAKADVDSRTGAFESRAIDRPPVTTFGGNGSRGIYSRTGGSSPRGVGGFIVYRNDHWLFDETDLYYGDVLGSGVALVGYESDGVAYTFRDGLPIPTGEDGTPAELEILALTPASLREEDHGHAAAVLLVGDDDLAFAAEHVLGSDSPEARERIARGAAVITHMHKGKGEVLCGGTTEWSNALDRGDPAVAQVVLNALRRFTHKSGI